MRKRLKKKVGKYRCLKCGSEDGVWQWFNFSTRKMIPSRLYCLYCDLGEKREKVS
jgi:hypothetical protein